LFRAVLRCDKTSELIVWLPARNETRTRKVPSLGRVPKSFPIWSICVVDNEYVALPLYGVIVPLVVVMEVIKANYCGLTTTTCTPLLLGL
jgi:hypothetical protein